MRACPACHTEMTSRNGIHVCPRHEIGDCAFDAYLEHEHYSRAPHTPHHLTVPYQGAYKKEQG